MYCYLTDWSGGIYATPTMCSAQKVKKTFVGKYFHMCSQRRLDRKFKSHLLCDSDRLGRCRCKVCSERVKDCCG